jgi:hypothetical protein
MVKNYTEYPAKRENRLFFKVFVGTKGVNSTEEDMVEIPELITVTCNWNAETVENDVYSNPAKASEKKSGAPSVSGEFNYIGTEVQKYIVKAGRALGTAAKTQVEVITHDNVKVSYIGIINVENFSADGGASDNNVVEFSIPYAGYDIVEEEITETTEPTE